MYLVLFLASLSDYFLLLFLMMMNCSCGMVDRRKAFSPSSSWDHCQRSSPSRISDTRCAGYQPAQNLSSGLVEWNCAVGRDNHYTTAPCLFYLFLQILENKSYRMVCQIFIKVIEKALHCKFFPFVNILSAFCYFVLKIGEL